MLCFNMGIASFNLKWRVCYQNNFPEPWRGRENINPNRFNINYKFNTLVNRRSLFPSEGDYIWQFCSGTLLHFHEPIWRQLEQQLRSEARRTAPVKQIYRSSQTEHKGRGGVEVYNMCGWSRLIACATRPAHPGPNCFVCGHSTKLWSFIHSSRNQTAVRVYRLICSTDVMQ